MSESGDLGTEQTDEEGEERDEGKGGKEDGERLEVDVK